MSGRTIAVDFDGTVTEMDLLDTIARDFGDPEVYAEVDRGLDEGNLPLRDVITREFEPVTSPLEEVVQWELDNVRVRDGFRDFVDFAREQGWRVVIVSSGFHELIEPILEREGVEVELHANRVDPSTDGWRVHWRYDESCDSCGESCKRSIVQELAGDDELVYIGDGYSDRCAAEASDLVFATRGLAEYLDDQGISYERFDDFHDVVRGLASCEPFDFALSTERFRAFGADLANLWHEGGVHRVFQGTEVRIEEAPGGVRITPGRAELAGEVRDYLGGPFDLDPFYAFAATEPVLARIVTELRGFRPPLSPDPYETLVSAITAQQISLRAAFAVRNRFIRAFGVKARVAYAFPTRERVALSEPEEIVALGFSRRKAEYAIGIARRDLDLRGLAALPDDEVKAALTALPGIGEWTADWFLGRHLARPDAWPAGDLGLRKAVLHFYGEEDTRAAGDRFPGFRNLAAHYLLTGHRVLAG